MVYFACQPIIFRSLKPCCSTSLLSPATRFLNFTSTRLQNTPNGDFPNRSGDRPHMYQLEHVQNRLADTVPMMFVHRLDYTFYHKGVVLDDKILNYRIQTLEHLIYYWGAVAVIFRPLYAYIRMEPLNILPLLEDGTVRLRWRIHYVSWFSLFDRRYWNKDFMMQNTQWFDGYSIFHVDGNGLVYHVEMQKTMPDEPRDMAKPKKKNIVEKLGQKLAENTSTAAASSNTSTNFAEDKTVDKKDDSIRRN